jgi:type III restriction enzyme
VTVRLRKGYETDAQFLALWERIRARTRYRVAYKTSELIAKAASRIKEDADHRTAQGGADPRRYCHRRRMVSLGKQTGFRTQTVEAKYVMPDFVGQVQA